MTDLDMKIAIAALRKALVERHDIMDVGPANEHPSQGPNWAMRATDLLDEIYLLSVGAMKP